MTTIKLPRKMIISTLLLTGLFLSGCNRDNLTPDSDNMQIHLEASISGQDIARVSDNGFEANDAIGVYIVDYVNGSTGTLKASENHAVSDASNVQHTLANNAWTTTETIYWNDKKTQADFYGYTPYQEPISDPSNINVSVQADQTNADNWEASDFLYSNNAKGEYPVESPVRMIFQHVMSKLDVTVQLGTEYSTDDEKAKVKNATVEIVGTVAKGTFNLSDGVIKPVDKGTVSAIKAQQTNTVTPGMALYSALLIPQKVTSGDLFLKVTFDGATYYYLAPNTDILPASGYSRSLTVTINKDKLSVAVGDICAWETSGTNIPDGTSKKGGIYSKEDLLAFATTWNDPKYTTTAERQAATEKWRTTEGIYTLHADIDLDKQTYSPIQNFEGTFDGQGHTISNLNIQKGDNLGLFSILGKSILKNIYLKNIYLKAVLSDGNPTSTVGGFCAQSTDKTTVIYNCHVIGDDPSQSNITGYTMGGIVGSGDATLINCSAELMFVLLEDIKPTKIGGLMGNATADTKISNSAAYPIIQHHDKLVEAGGIAHGPATLSNCVVSAFTGDDINSEGNSQFSYRVLTFGEGTSTDCYWDKENVDITPVDVTSQTNILLFNNTAPLTTNFSFDITTGKVDIEGKNEPKDIITRLNNKAKEHNTGDTPWFRWKKDEYGQPIPSGEIAK